MTFTCSICETEHFAIPFFGPVDTCVDCCADADGLDVEEWQIDTPDSAHYRLWPRRHI